MRWVVVLWVTACLAVMGSVAQPVEPASHRTPAALGGQLILNHAPALVDSAISESLHDGTPDRAEALAADLVAFAAGLQRDLSWPSQATLDRGQAIEAYAHAAAVAATLQEVPPAVGTIARYAADCSAYFETATADEATAWIEGAREADALESALSGELSRLVAATPDGLDAAPLREAHAMFQDWLNAGTADARVCFAGLDERLALDLAAGTLTARAVPREPFPTQNVALLGVAHGFPVDEVVMIRAPALGWDFQVARNATGHFRAEATIPADAAFGNHTLAVQVSNRTVNLTLDVIPIPLFLDVQHPARVTPGSRFDMIVEVGTPVAALRASTDAVAVRGDLEAVAQLQNDSALISFEAPDARGRLRGAVAFIGHPAFGTVTAGYVIDVRPAAALAGPQAGGSLSVLERIIDHAVFIAAGVLVLIVLVSALALRRPRENRGAPAASAQRPPPPAPPPGLIAAFGALVAWLVATGLARASDTARAIGRTMKTRGVPADGFVQSFERARYGGATPPAPVGDRAQSWVERAMHWIWRRQA